MFVDEDFAKLIEDLKSEYGTRFEAQGVRMDQLEAALRQARADITSLEKALDEKEKEVTTIKQRANEQEQYMRSWSIRVLDLPIPQGQDPNDNTIVMKHVFNLVLLPILKGAVQRGLLHGIPSHDQILETAHILPCKPGQTPPIIARFYSRNIKALVFRLKRDFSTKVTDPDPTPSQSRSRRQPAKPAHPFYEDLTTHNFHKMRALANDQRVLACWSVAGQLRFRLNNEERVRRVINIFDSIDNIISASNNTISNTGPSNRTNSSRSFSSITSTGTIHSNPAPITIT